MPLIGDLHRDRPSAALSITANRLSKIHRLWEAGDYALAETYLRHLSQDVFEFIASGECLANPRLGQDLATMLLGGHERIELRPSVLSHD